MVRNVLREFDVPFKEHDCDHKWCVDLHNIASSKKVNGSCSLQTSEGNTQDISILRFHLWGPIWYFNKCKSPKNPCQLATWEGFAHSNGDEMCFYIKTEEKNPNYLII